MKIFTKLKRKFIKEKQTPETKLRPRKIHIRFRYAPYDYRMIEIMNERVDKLFATIPPGSSIPPELLKRHLSRGVLLPKNTIYLKQDQYPIRGQVIMQPW